MTSVDPRRTQPFCTSRCASDCRCSRWDHYRDRFGFFTSEAYANKILNAGPIAYWTLWEGTGFVAHCIINPAQNGAYSSPVQTWPPGDGVGDGNTAPYFDGVNHFVDIGNVAFRNRFNGITGTCIIWDRVGNAGTWTDGQSRYAIHVRVDGNNDLYFQKAVAANNMRWSMIAGGVGGGANSAVGPSTDWYVMGATWGGGQFQRYLNGGAEGAPIAIGAWAGLPAAITTMIGSGNSVPVNVWNGWQAHCAVFDRALTDAEMLDLATV